MKKYEHAIGIEFGLSYSRVAIFRNDSPDVIADETGSTSIPSCIAFTEEKILFGQQAKSLAIKNAPNVIQNLTRLLGLVGSDEKFEELGKNCRCKIIETFNKHWQVIVPTPEGVKTYFIEEVLGLFITHLAKLALKNADLRETLCVISVPNDFNFFEREAVRTAASLAGLDYARVINKTDALAFNHVLNLHDHSSEAHMFLFISLGSGSINAALAEAEDELIEIRSQTGDNTFGGEEIDQLLVKFFASKFKSQTGLDVSNNKKALVRLKAACESAKKELSISKQTRIDIYSLVDEQDFVYNLTITEFNELAQPYFNKVLSCVDEVLSQSGVTPRDVASVVLAGGCAHIPVLKEIILGHLKTMIPVITMNIVNSKIEGSILIAAYLTTKESNLLKNALLLEVNPHSAGFQLSEGVLTVIQQKNSTLPCLKHTFLTIQSKDQASLFLFICEENKSEPSKPSIIGTLEIENINDKAVDAPMFEVKFDKDAEGILKVGVLEQSSGEQKVVRINRDLKDLNYDQIVELIRNDSSNLVNWQFYDQKMLRDKLQLGLNHLQKSAN